jgi:hypothetical protein
LRNSFASSRLVRLLGDPALVNMPSSGMDFAERLSLWLNAFDAIGLQSAHQAIRSIDAPAAARPEGARAARTRNVAEDFQRVHAVLRKAISLDPLAHGKADAADAADPACTVFHQRHLELQRQMEQMIAALRDHVRQALCRASPRLRQLAVLDAAFEQLLAPREQALLPTAAALLKRRFEQLRQTDDGLEIFRRQWGEALLAELDLRLEPVAGLIEALSNEAKNP